VTACRANLDRPTCIIANCISQTSHFINVQIPYVLNIYMINTVVRMASHFDHFNTTTFLLHVVGIIAPLGRTDKATLEKEVRNNCAFHEDVMAV
jgi:hypothetical protein